MSFINQSFINIIQANQPPGGFGPNVNTTLTNKLSGTSFTERQFLKALEIRKNLRKLQRPPRQLTDMERAELRLGRAESANRGLPAMIYGHEGNAEMVRSELNEAQESLRDLRAAQLKRNAIDAAKAKIRAALDARKKH